MKTRKMIMFTGAAIMAAGMMAGCAGDTKETTAGAHDRSTHNSGRDHKGNCGRDRKDHRGSRRRVIRLHFHVRLHFYGEVWKRSGGELHGKISGCDRYRRVYRILRPRGGSSSGASDIGNSSRNLKDEEKSAGAVENIVAIDGIAVAVDPKNTVTDLTKDQLISIYTGEVKNWSDLGGENMPIVVVGREAGSGTRGAFEEILGIEDKCVYANELDSTGAVMAKVASTPGAIGYISLDAVDDSVIALKLEGVAPSAETIKSGEYFLSRPFVMRPRVRSASRMSW